MTFAICLAVIYGAFLLYMLGTGHSQAHWIIYSVFALAVSLLLLYAWFVTA